MPLNPIQQRLGKTAYDGQTVDAANLLYVDKEGFEWNNIANVDASQVLTGQETRNLRNGKKRRARLVRNINGAALVPGDIVKYAPGFHGRRVVAGTAAGLFAGVVDELLPAAGCPDDDLCWIIVEGETLCNKTSTDVLAEFSFLATGATKLVTTAATIDVDGSHVGMVVAAAGNPSAQVLAHVNALHG